MDALTLIDYNGWRVVFQKLNAVDHLSCRQVCKPFHKLLDEKEFEDERKFHFILPHLFPYFQSGSHFYNTSWRNLHSLRLTCSSWLESVDKYLSEAYKPSYIPFNGMRRYPLVTHLRISREIEDFQSAFGESDANPFPSKTVFINMDRPWWLERRHYQSHVAYAEAVNGLSATYIEKVANFTEQFGKHISKLELWFVRHFLDSLSFLKLLKRITIHLPNLKTFFIRNDTFLQLPDQEKMVTDWIAEQENSLAAAKLQELQFNEVDLKIEYYLLDMYAPQLTILGKTTVSNPLQQVHLEKLRNLKELRLTNVDSTNTLELLRFLKSPLKILQLVFNPSNHINYHLTWSIDKVLRNIKHLPLKHLMIKVNSAHYRVDFEEAGLPLEEYINENIQSLTIRLNWNFDHVSFNFVQALQKLEKLELETPHRPTSHPPNSPEVVKLNEYLFGEERTDLPYQSNLWEKVPSLKTLITKRDDGIDGTEYDKLKYTREQYEIVTSGGEMYSS